VSSLCCKSKTYRKNVYPITFKAYVQKLLHYGESDCRQNLHDVK
jgi:hypothetical protein